VKSTAGRAEAQQIVKAAIQNYAHQFLNETIPSGDELKKDMS
jgi:hypothetical protein